MSKKENISKIIHCAIKLFSSRGYSETSIRMISQTASVGLGTINFYFQSKEELFVATVRQVVEDTNHERHILLLRARREGLTLERIIDAVLWPLVWRVDSLDPVERGKPYLLRWALHGPDSAERRLTRLLDPIASEFVEAIREILPNLTRRDAFWGFSMAISVLYSRQMMDGRYDHLIDGTRAIEGRRGTLQHRHLIAFVAGGLRSLADGKDSLSRTREGLNSRSASVLSDVDPLH